MAVFMGKLAPDVHRELHRFTSQERRSSCRSEPPSLGRLIRPHASYRGTGAKLDIPGADFWYVENGKIKECSCYVIVSTMLEQMGIKPDFASVVGAQAAAQEAMDKAAKEELAKFEGTWRLRAQ